ncbi:MAG: RibD family protein [Methylotenera sp.]|nr:RibD family protein [Oligoflexia bacterium]
MISATEALTNSYPMNASEARTLAVDLKWAQTLDGQLCDDSGSSQWISGKEERTLTHSLRTRYDAIAVGVSTYLNDRAQLTVREGYEQAIAKQPARVIMDPRGRLASHLATSSVKIREACLQDLTQGPRDTYVIGKTQGLMLHERGRLKLIETELEFESPHFEKNVRKALSSLPSLRAGGKFRLLVEGGPRILRQFLATGFFDEVLVSIAPMITGGKLHRIELLRTLPKALSLDVVRRSQAGCDTFIVLKKRLESA